PGATGPTNEVGGDLDCHRFELGRGGLERPVGNESLAQRERDSSPPQRPKAHSTNLEYVWPTDRDSIDEVTAGATGKGLPPLAGREVCEQNGGGFDRGAIGSEHRAADRRRSHALRRERTDTEQEEEKERAVRRNLSFGRQRRLPPLPLRLLLPQKRDEPSIAPDVVQERIAYEQRIAGHPALCHPITPLHRRVGPVKQRVRQRDVISGMMKVDISP